MFFNGFNIGLSIWFVVGLEWSVEGVFLVIVLSEIVICVFGFVLVLLVICVGLWLLVWIVFDKWLFLCMLVFNWDIMICLFVLLYVYVFFMVCLVD